MEIIYNDRHALHDIGGRFTRNEGECLVHYWDKKQISISPEPIDDQECPYRILNILTRLEIAGFSKISPPADFGIEPILDVHTPDYIETLKTIYKRNCEDWGVATPVFPMTFAVRKIGRKPTCVRGLLGYYAFDIFTSIGEHTWEAAYWSAQCALTGAELSRGGAKTVYTICRPSGHHAFSDMFGGYCFLNNAAIAARYLQKKTLKNVAILDIDFHHGNGTQAIFYSDPKVLFCSIHGDPDFAFPYYTGYFDERGEGAGEGYNYNWPLAKGTDDKQYINVLEKAIAVIRDYTPGFLVVSAGFDTGLGDPYGGFSLTQDGFHEIGKHVSNLTVDIPILIIQEGGYVPEKLGDYVVSFLSAFA
jgi:acetoin utilization deacetylase AcuC-like enzyme